MRSLLSSVSLALVLLAGLAPPPAHAGIGTDYLSVTHRTGGGRPSVMTAIIHPKGTLGRPSPHKQVFQAIGAPGTRAQLTPAAQAKLTRALKARPAMPRLSDPTK